MTRPGPRYKQAAIPRSPNAMPYVQVAPNGRYFVTEDGQPFLPVGHNDGICFPYMYQLRGEKDTATTEAYIKMMAEHGVNLVRIMLEYCSSGDWYFEHRIGSPLPKAVLYWDNLIGLCERYGVRLLILFWDTFFMSRRWKHHPYSRSGTGFEGQWSCCTSPEAMEAQKGRIRFFIERWGNSSAIFGYDLFNEIHPHWGGSPEDQHRWVTEMARFVKQCEMKCWGKRHLLTLSVFGWKPESDYIDLVFRHPELDFATTHVYKFGLVDNPENTIDCAIVMRDAVKFAYEHIRDARPYTDTESGPIHAFMDLGKRLNESFDDEYHHNMTWAHLATGGAGSGMRWPFREPHCLSPGMHDTQLAMSRFITAQVIDWAHYSPQPVDHALRLIGKGGEAPRDPLPVLPFGCANGRQAVIWLLRDLRVTALDAEQAAAYLSISCLESGEYIAEFWDTYAGVKTGDQSFTTCECGREARLALPAFKRDLAIAIKPFSQPQSA